MKLHFGGEIRRLEKATPTVSELQDDPLLVRLLLFIRAVYLSFSRLHTYAIITLSITLFLV